MELQKHGSPRHGMIRKNSKHLISFVQTKGMKWGHLIGISLTNNFYNNLPGAKINFTIPSPHVAINEILVRFPYNQSTNWGYQKFRENIRWNPSALKILKNDRPKLRILD